MAKANAKFMAPLTPSAALAAVVGSNPLPRTEIVKKMWDYIKKNGLQDSTNKRMINSDDKLAVEKLEAKLAFVENDSIFIETITRSLISEISIS